MTPFGHLGSGLLIVSIAEKTISKGQLSPKTLGVLALLSILPDIDGALAFIIRKWQPGQEMLKHHNYPTHTPIFFLFLSILVWIIFGERISILFLILTLTHLVLDSWGTDDGIMWLWPLSSRQFSLFPINLHEGGVFGIQYYLRYIRCLRLMIPETLLFVGGIVSAMKFWH